MSTLPLRTETPAIAPACPDWCEDAGRCKWEPLTHLGARELEVPIGTWVCFHSLGNAGELVCVFGRELSHRPGAIEVAAWIDPTLIEVEGDARADELREAAKQMTEAARMIEAVTA